MRDASVEDLFNRFHGAELIQVTDETGNGVVDQARVDQALAAASAAIDSYLRPRYRLPLASVPVRLIDLACDIARFLLQHGGDRIPTDQAEKAHDRAISFLKDVSKGLADLGLDATGSPAPESPGAPLAGPRRPFPPHRRAADRKSDEG